MLGYSSNQTQENDTLNQESRNRNGDQNVYMKNILKKRSIGPSD